MIILRKICVLGDVSVGKTSLIRRFVDRRFDEAYLSTVGVTISRKAVRFSIDPGTDPVELQLILWDIEGGSTFRSVASSYLMGAHAAIVVADVARDETLQALPSHIKSFRIVSPRGCVFVALNKSDLRPSIRVGELWQEWTNGSEPVLTSAKTGEGVDLLFDLIGKRLWKERDHASTC